MGILKQKYRTTFPIEVAIKLNELEELKELHYIDYTDAVLNADDERALIKLDRVRAVEKEIDVIRSRYDLCYTLKKSLTTVVKTAIKEDNLILVINSLKAMGVKLKDIEQETGVKQSNINRYIKTESCISRGLRERIYTFASDYIR